MKARLIASTSLILLTLSACVVGPDYKRPDDAVPSQFKGADTGSWKEGLPTDYRPKGNWWTVFNDQALNRLQSRAAQANQQVQAAIARVDQARSAAKVARGEQLPKIASGSSFSRSQFSTNQVPNFGGITANQFRVPLDLSYEIDLWGRVRRSVESARADAEATLAAFHGVLLILHADVAQHYFSLRALDAELLTLADTVQLRKKQLELVVNKSKGGAGNELDVTRAETALASTEAEKAGLSQRRAELENALAILVGANPSTFSFPAASGGKGQDWKPTPPSIPSGLPSDLLERRPDVAEAERQLASANARIGVAKASFFPAVSLTGSGGSVSADFQDLFSWDSRAWSIGPSVSLPIFAGGRNLANYRRSKSGYQEAVARYRQSVLVAFGDVESSLAGIRYLAEQSAAIDRVVTSSSRGAELASQRYEAGVVSYLEVVDADREALQAQRARVQLTGLRLIASVQLVKALGGSWDPTH